MAQEHLIKANLADSVTSVRRKSYGPANAPGRAVPADIELAGFFDRSLDLLCIAGFDGHFRRLNPAWTTCLGWTREQLQASPFLDFVHPADRKLTLSEFDRLVEDGVTVLFENRYRHRNGSYRWLQWNARGAGGSEYISAIARDITRQKELEREIIRIADRERERLGRELHDGLCQTLAGIGALSSTLARRLAASRDSAASASAAEIAQLLGETVGQARDLARGLGPIGLKMASLDEALETLTLNVERMFGISCRLECEVPLMGLSCDTKTNLYRIAQEAVHNAATHGRADEILIGLCWMDSRGIMTVRDNGVGIPEGARNAGGIGLHTMAYRARLLGGSLEVRGSRRRGTVVTCAFPLPEKLDSRGNPNHEYGNG